MKNGKLTLTLDAAYCFDFYSIIERKYFENPTEDNLKNLRFYRTEMIDQLGVDKFYEVYLSSEYAQLAMANEQTFAAVERARKDPLFTAKEMDYINMTRHPAKRALQEKFFGNNLTEIKT